MSFEAVRSANPNVTIRRAQRQDVLVIYEMLRESAIVQDGVDKLCADPVNLVEDGFGTEPRFQCLLAELDGDVVGMILYFFIYSTWSSRNGLYIEDLYVRSQHFRQGIGRALMSEAARVAVHAGCHYVQWMVLDSNSDAIKFYDSIGAVALSECSVMRVAGEGLELLSNVRTEG